MKQVLKIIFKVLRYCYLVFLGIYLVFIFLHRISIDTDIFGYRITSITNSEMIPKYNVEDIVLVKKIKTKDLKVGDTISFVGTCCGIEDKVINHEIVKIEEDGFITKGTNFEVEDPKVEEKQILGKVLGKIPLINEMHHILVNQLGFFLIVFCPLVIVIVIQILQTIHELKKEKEENKEEVI